MSRSPVEDSTFFTTIYCIVSFRDANYIYFKENPGRCSIKMKTPKKKKVHPPHHLNNLDHWHLLQIALALMSINNQNMSV